MRILSLFIATSLDGYIAKPNDDLSFLKLVEKEGWIMATLPLSKISTP